MLAMVNPYSTPDHLWHTNPELAARMVKEWEKIEPYKAKGFIADWP